MSRRYQRYQFEEIAPTELGYRISIDDLNHGTGQVKDCSFRALGERTGMDLDEVIIQQVLIIVSQPDVEFVLKKIEIYH